MTKKRFKPEFEGCTVTIKSPTIGKVSINATTADPNKWAEIPEFAHMFEDDVPEEAPKPTKPTPKKTQSNVSNDTEPPVRDFKQQPLKESERVGVEVVEDLTKLSLKELRERFPDIKDTSKKGFLEKLGL